MKARFISFSIIIALVLGGTVSVVLQYATKPNVTPDTKGVTHSENPLYEEYQQIGRRHGLDMQFTKYAQCDKMTFTHIVGHPLLSIEPRSLDILIFGDSCVAWGIIPEVIEQMTGLRVGLFAFEAFPLNLASVKVIDNIASYYLKPEGLFLLGFSNWFYEQNAHGPILLHSDWMYRVGGMTKSGFERYMERERNRDVAGEISIREIIARYVDFASYRKMYGEFKSYLGENLHLSLFQIALYGDYMEPFINPGWHNKKKSMVAQIHCFLRWNNRSVTVHKADAGTRSLYSDTPGDPSFANKHTSAVSAAVSRLGFRKVFLINLKHADKKYTKLRSIYSAYYREIAELIDLGRAHPRNESYEMDEREHPINTGSLHQSIILGKELRKLLIDRPQGKSSQPHGP